MITSVFCHRNGGYETSPPLGRYCGSNPPPRIISHSNKLWLKFKSDFFGSGPGFSAYWDGSLTGKRPRPIFIGESILTGILIVGLLCSYLFFFQLYFVSTIYNKLQHCEYFWINSSRFVFIFIFEGQSKGKCSSSLV